MRFHSYDRHCGERGDCTGIMAGYAAGADLLDDLAGS